MVFEESMNTREEMLRLREQAKNRKPPEVVTMTEECQKEIDRLNKNPRLFLDEWYASGDLSKTTYISLTLQLRQAIALEARRGKK